MPRHFSLITVEDYAPLVGREAVERLREKARALQDLRLVHVNSTYYGGGVAQLLSSLTLLMSSLGIKTEWRVIQGSHDFFTITKKIHNALQGGPINLTDRKKEIYEKIVYENAVRNQLDHDLVMIHDPQPLFLVHHYRKRGPWIWRCHVDLTQPHQELWDYLTPTIEEFDTVILTLQEYKQDLQTPQLCFLPAIDPFSITNREFQREEIEERLAYYQIPTDLPLVVQISRFDRWKDPEGVIQAYQLACKEVPCTLVLLGNVATDDPEGEDVYKSLLSQESDRIRIMSCQDAALVNALQRRATVVMQKSLREGFGLTVAEAMFKGTPVIGGNVGGIRYQIQDGVNGFLVSSVEEAAQRLVQLLKDPQLRAELGERARETARTHFLLIRYLEQYLDLFSSFETYYRLRSDFRPPVP